MIIENGYWNYYMAFQVQGAQDILACIEAHQYDDFVVASYLDGTVLNNMRFTECEDDDIQLYLKNNINVLNETGQATTKILGEKRSDKCSVSLLSPLRLQYENGQEMYCRVYMFLLNNGLGVLKTCVPLHDFSAEPFQCMPLRKWYKDASIITVTEGAKSSVRNVKETNTVDDIVWLLQKIIKKTFAGHLVTDEKYMCFESLIFRIIKRESSVIQLPR